MFYVGKRFIVKSCRVMWPQLASAAAAFNLDPLPCSSGLWDIWYAGRGAGGGGDCVSSANVSFCFLSGLYYQYSYYYYCVSLAAARVCVWKCESVKVCVRRGRWWRLMDEDNGRHIWILYVLQRHRLQWHRCLNHSEYQSVQCLDQRAWNRSAVKSSLSVLLFLSRLLCTFYFFLPETLSLTTRDFLASKTDAEIFMLMTEDWNVKDVCRNVWLHSWTQGRLGSAAA